MKNNLTAFLLAAFAMVALAVGSPVSAAANPAIKIGSDCDLVVVGDASVCATGDEPEDEDEDEDGILVSLTPINLQLL